MIRTALALVACAALSACTTPSLLVELEHVSHPTAGWPLEKQHNGCQPGPGQICEDSLTQLNTMARWRWGGGFYLDAGAGINALGKTGGGFVGPALTGTVRIGYEFTLVKR